MSKKKTTEEFKEEVKRLTNNEYKVMEEYKGTNIKIKMKHNLCNSVFDVKPNMFLNMGTRCPYCYGNRKKTTEEFKEEIFNLVGNEYELISKYDGNKKKVTLKHNCGYEYEVAPVRFISGDRCPKCSGKKQKTTEVFKDEIFKLVGNEYELLEDYKTVFTKVEFIHNKCNKKFLMRPNNFLNGQRCPYCKSSKGEKSIQDYLTKNNISFIKQKYFEDCKDKKYLPFDFYLEDYNLCIEYDGEFHYRNVYYESCLEKTKLHDKMKDEYCNKNNINLLRINYKEKNDIERIIDEALFEIEHSTII